MLSLSQNCSYRFMKDDARVVAMCKKPVRQDHLIADSLIAQNVAINPLRYSYYTEPVIDRKGLIKNTLITFVSDELCSVWKARASLILGDNHVSGLLQRKGSLDRSHEVMFNDKVHNVALTLEDMKDVSAEMKLELLVIMDAKNHRNALHSNVGSYEVYYYNAKHKQLNF